MNRIKQLRLIQCLTQEALAERANLSVSYLSEIENGRVTPSLKALKKIAAVLKMPVSSLLESVGGDGVGNVGTNCGSNFNNFGNNFGTNNFAVDTGRQLDGSASADCPAAPAAQAFNGSARSSSVCPFAYMADPNGSGDDAATFMIIASLCRMSAENRRKLLQYAVGLV